MRKLFFKMKIKLIYKKRRNYRHGGKRKGGSGGKDKITFKRT